MFEVVTNATLAEYERFNASHPNGHFMQSHAWALVKDQWRWRAIVVRGDDGAITGSLSALIRQVPGTPYTIMYAGRAPVCDYHDRATLAALTEGAAAVAARNRAYVLTMDPDVAADDAEFAAIMADLGYTRKAESKDFEDIQPRFVFRLDIAGKSEEAVFAGFSQKTRYNIRLAAKKGVTVHVAGPDEVDAFSAIMDETGVRDGFIVRGADYFRRLLACLGENARLYMAHYEGRPVAGTLAIHYGDKVWYLYGASSNEYRNVMPNYLLQWEMIRWAIQSGCRLYDFRGVSGDLSEDNPLYGLYRFKKGFNGDFTEFAGEFNYVFSPVAYAVIEKALATFRTARTKLFQLRHRGPHGPSTQ